MMESACINTWLLTVILLGVGTARGYKETFSSLANIQKLIIAENNLLSVFEEHKTWFLQREGQTERIFTRIFARLERQKGKDIVELRKYSWHPLNCYHLIKEWALLQQALKDAEHDIVAKSFSELVKNSSIELPHLQDVRGSAAAALRLQYTYLLDTERLGRGDIMGHMSLPLEAEDMLILGVAAVKGKYKQLASQWLDLSIRESADWKEIQILASVHVLLSMYPEDESMHVILGIFKLREAGVMQEYVQEHVADMDRGGTERYRRLCRGENSPQTSSELSCRYKMWLLPYVSYKEEVISWVPRVSMFYDVLSESDGSVFKRLAQPELFRAKVGNPKDPEESEDRVGMLSWVWDSSDQRIPYLSKKVSAITGLDTTYRPLLSSSEPFQVVNYGIGGQYEPHKDAFDNKDWIANEPDYLQNTGVRLATFIFYLGDVILGGSTVFPDAGVRVPAIKYGGVVWYNVQLNGEIEGDSLHAGCPVLYGEKWIATKWIREFGNEFNRPCGQDKNTKHDFYNS